MNEQELAITTNGQYKNINLKTRYKWNAQTKQFEFDSDGNKVIVAQGVKPDHYVILTKGDYPEGYPVEGKFGTSYSYKVTYKGEEVSFFLNKSIIFLDSVALTLVKADKKDIKSSSLIV